MQLESYEDPTNDTLVYQIRISKKFFDNLEPQELAVVSAFEEDGSIGAKLLSLACIAIKHERLKNKEGSDDSGLILEEQKRD